MSFEIVYTGYLKKLLFFTALLPLLCGCYHISTGGSSSISKNIGTVSVPLFTNKTEKMGIEVPITESFIQRLDYYGAKNVKDIKNSRSIIEGIVTNYKISTVAKDQRHKVVEYSLSITIDLNVRDTKGNEVIFKKEDYSDNYEFKVSRDSVNRRRETEKAEKMLCDRMASSILTEIYEGI